MAHQPFDGLGLLVGESEPGTKFECDIGAEFGMIAPPTLGNIVQQHRYIERAPGLDLVDDLGRDRHILDILAFLDTAQDTDGKYGVLVDRIDMIHVVLHLGDDAAEIGDEATENPGLVQAAQRCLGIGLRRQHFRKQAVRLGIVPNGIDHVQVPRDRPQRLGVYIELLGLRRMKQAQYLYRIINEFPRFGDIQAATLDLESLDRFLEQPERREPEFRFTLVFRLERRTEYARQIADLLRDQIIMFHETFDAARTRTISIPQKLRNFRLHVEGQAVLAAPGKKVEVTPHIPQETMGAIEAARLFL